MGVLINPALVRRLVEQDPIPAWLGDEHNWQRVYARTSGGNQAVLVYEPAAGASGAVCVALGEPGQPVLGGVGPARRFHWWQDAALPALNCLAARTPRLEPVRYRPGKRCTLRSTTGRALFVKCLADQRGWAINRDARLLHRARRDGLLGFGVARPAGWLGSSRLLVQHAVPGSPVIERLRGAGGAALAARLGAANATLAAAPITPEPRFTYEEQMLRTRKYVARLAHLLPSTLVISADLLKRLATVDPGPADRPIHGAPHAHQWLDGPDGLMLVDFDRFACGDPELDVATFVAEADFENGASEDIGRAYRAAFEGRWPLDPALVSAYRTHKHIAKALRVATALRTDAAERALAILDHARSLVGGDE